MGWVDPRVGLVMGRKLFSVGCVGLGHWSEMAYLRFTSKNQQANSFCENLQFGASLLVPIVFRCIKVRLGMGLVG